MGGVQPNLRAEFAIKTIQAELLLLRFEREKTVEAATLGQA